jgi:hypothetical protein
VTLLKIWSTDLAGIGKTYVPWLIRMILDLVRYESQCLSNLVRTLVTRLITQKLQDDFDGNGIMKVKHNALPERTCSNGSGYKAAKAMKAELVATESRVIYSLHCFSQLAFQWLAGGSL